MSDILMKLEEVEQLIRQKHQPGKHPQKRHAGERGAKRAAQAIETKVQAVKSSGKALASAFGGTKRKYSQGRSTVTAVGDAGRKLYEGGKAELEKQGFEFADETKSEVTVTHTMRRYQDGLGARFFHNTESGSTKVTIQ